MVTLYKWLTGGTLSRVQCCLEQRERPADEGVPWLCKYHLKILNVRFNTLLFIKILSQTQYHCHFLGAYFVPDTTLSGGSAEMN